MPVTNAIDRTDTGAVTERIETLLAPVPDDAVARPVGTEIDDAGVDVVRIQASNRVPAAALALPIRLAGLSAKWVINAVPKVLFLKRRQDKPLVFGGVGELLDEQVADPEPAEVGVPKRLCPRARVVVGSGPG
jgi:hypothetical protein